ncbi:MAG TPA: hypothetical protein VEQ85_14295, partial [Lacipirellulaceae bacterium]|nr:hypothetical protein [Lacipirellulaceae bacterium]
MPSPDPDKPLVGNLTVGEARHLINTEGGELTGPEVVAAIFSALVVSGFTARAIAVGNASAWHLVLPMVAQYVALLLAMPWVYLIVRHPAMRRDAVGGLQVIVGLPVVLAIVLAVRSHDAGAPWRDQLAADASALARWITDAQMHWPMLLAVAGILLALPGRVRALYLFGPPFSAVNLGCGMRVVVLLLGAAILPWAMGNRTRMAWTLWAMLLAAELLALWMHWDVQKALRNRKPS